MTSGPMHPDEHRRQSCGSQSEVLVKRGVTPLKKRHPCWHGFASIASPYIRQLRYGLPLCCMHGRSREKNGAHLMTPPEPARDIKNVPCLQEKYWKRPTDPKPQGDPNVDPVYAAVGRALSQWERLEQQLATLFIVVTRASDSSGNAVRRAYGAIENGTLRRKAIIAAAEVHFGASWQPHVAKAYNKLIDAVSGASKLRDDIAHGIVQHFKLNDIDYGAFLFRERARNGSGAPPLWPASKEQRSRHDGGGRLHEEFKRRIKTQTVLPSAMRPMLRTACQSLTSWRVARID